MNRKLTTLCCHAVALVALASSFTTAPAAFGDTSPPASNGEVQPYQLDQLAPSAFALIVTLEYKLIPNLVATAIQAMPADRWRDVIFAIALAFAACAYLPKLYRSLGAYIRYLKRYGASESRRLKLIALAAGALFVGGLREQFCTANANDKGVSPKDETTELLIKGAGVDGKDVYWRITAGLSPKQAVDVAVQERLERDVAAFSKKHEDSSDNDLRKMSEKAGLPVANVSRSQLIIALVQSGKAAPSAKAETDESAADETNLDNMTVAELKKLAAKRKVEITPDMKKADIIAAIEGGE